MKINRRQVLKGVVSGIAGLAISDNLFASAKATLTKDQGHPAIKVINAGIGGNNTMDMLARLDTDCLSQQPKLTILMVGTNDMNSAKHISIADYERNLIELVRKVKSAGSKVLLMTILPMYEPHLFTRHKESFYQPEGVKARRTQLNEVIKKVSQKYNIHFLDLGQRFSAIGKIGLDKDSLLQNEANSNKTDGIHPTANGYRFIALAVYDYLIYHHLVSSPIVCFGDSITRGDGTMERDSYPAYLKKLLEA